MLRSAQTFCCKAMINATKDWRMSLFAEIRSNCKDFLGDIGFQKTAKGYFAVVDDMDLDYRLARDFIRRLQTQYHEATARKNGEKAARNARQGARRKHYQDLR